MIFGVSGFVGSNLAHFLSADYKVIGTYHKNRVSIPGIPTIPCNVVNKEEVRLALFTFRPDIAIYCAGLSSVYECYKNEDMADALNNVGLFNVIEFCQRYKAQVCFLSSSHVFSGEKKSYIEMDTPDANTIYGKNQTAAEFYIQKTGINYIIFRCCRLYGRSLNPFRSTWFEKLQRKIILKEIIVCDDYIHSGFLDVSYLAIILKMCFQKKVSNRLFQVSSNDIYTYCQFAKMYCEIFRENPDVIEKGTWKFPMVKGSHIPQGKDLYYDLNLSNIEGFLNIQMPTVKESLEFTLLRLNGKVDQGRKKRSKSAIEYI